MFTECSLKDYKPRLKELETKRFKEMKREHVQNASLNALIKARTTDVVMARRARREATHELKMELEYKNLYDWPLEKVIPSRPPLDPL